ncbi:MAG: hypothetical protein CR972_02955 [Candidatus Moraniibacteriota bacterium]|nr:MAG: hypothetical protein CR972_02955 [Candidatus Moranbacteria bacterium]
MDFSREHDRVIPQKCPVCGAQRENLSYVPLGYDEERTIVHISCKKCAGAAMIFVSQNDAGLMTVGVLTDTTPIEAKQFFDLNIISDNDVIAVHDYLSNYDGYASEMF